MSWESILKAKPSWADKTDLKDLTPDEVNDLARIRENWKTTATKEEKYYYNQLRNLRGKLLESKRKKQEEDTARAGKRPVWRAKELPEELPEEVDYSDKRKGYITLEDFIKHNLKKYKKGESIFAQSDNPLHFKLVKSKLILMRGNKEKSISNQKFAEAMNWYIIPKSYKDINDLRHFKIDDSFQTLIEKLGKEKLGLLYYIFTGKKAAQKEKPTEYLDLIQGVFGHIKYSHYDYSEFRKKIELLWDAYNLYGKNIPKDEWKPEQQKIAHNIKGNKIKGMLTIAEVIEKHISNEPNYEFKKSTDRAVNDFQRFYKVIRLFNDRKNTLIGDALNDLTGKESFHISDKLKNKWDNERQRVKLFLSKYDLTNRQQNIIVTLFEEISDAIFKHNEKDEEYTLTKEEVKTIINNNINDLKGEDFSTDFIKSLKGQFLRLIKELGEVEGIDELKTIIDSFESSSREFGEPTPLLTQAAETAQLYAPKDAARARTQGPVFQKALNPKLASLPEEPIKRLKKTLQAAEPSEYFGQDYTRLGELIDLLQEMDFTKGDNELDEKIESISEQNIDMVATAARLRKTYETLYLQVRKIVYPKASEGSLREEEEA